MMPILLTLAVVQVSERKLETQQDIFLVYEMASCARNEAQPT